MRTAALTWTLALLMPCSALGAESRPIRDKTLVAWVSPGNLTQQGGSVLTLENPGGVFDAIVLGEIQPARWMAGSNFYRRTQRDQTHYPAETAGPDTLVQVAIVYRGKEISIFRDGKPYAGYTMPGEPVEFSTRSILVIGLRHLDAGANAGRHFIGSIDDARVYDRALDAAQIAALKPNEPSDPKPVGWWSFESAKPEDSMGTFPPGHLVGDAKIEGGRLRLGVGDGYRGAGFMVAGAEPPRDRAAEAWPRWHVAALPDEGFCRPYDANGCIYWKGKYHLMYIFQNEKGHCWGHLSSTDLVHWTYHPASLEPMPGDPDRGIFSGNAFVNKEGVPMLCWFGIDAGVCVATAEDAELIRWKKHPANPIIPMPEPGQPGHGVYRVWDPYLWLEGDTYYCLLGGNVLPGGKDTLYLCKSPDMVHWKALHPFYEHPDPSWTTGGEDCSCPDFFKLADKHVLMCISHKVGGRMYIGRYEKEKFYPESHVRMNWPGGNFFAPESLLDDRGRRIFWAWVTDPRSFHTQRATGSGVQSLPRVLALAKDGTVRITPVEELQTLRRNPRSIAPVPLEADADVTLENVRGDSMELAVEIDPGQARQVGLKVRCSPDGKEETAIWYDPGAGKLSIDVSRSTLRKDVAYCDSPIQMGNARRTPNNRHPKPTVEAPFALGDGQTLKLRVFLDGPMLEVFANDRQCVTQQIFPDGKESLGVKACSRGGPAALRSGEAWDMAPVRFVDQRKGPPGK